MRADPPSVLSQVGGRAAYAAYGAIPAPLRPNGDIVGSTSTAPFVPSEVERRESKRGARSPYLDFARHERVYGKAWNAEPGAQPPAALPPLRGRALALAPRAAGAVGGGFLRGAVAGAACAGARTVRLAGGEQRRLATVRGVGLLGGALVRALAAGMERSCRHRIVPVLTAWRGAGAILPLAGRALGMGVAGDGLLRLGLGQADRVQPGARLRLADAVLVLLHLVGLGVAFVVRGVGVRHRGAFSWG